MEGRQYAIEHMSYRYHNVTTGFVSRCSLDKISLWFYRCIQLLDIEESVKHGACNEVQEHNKLTASPQSAIFNTFPLVTNRLAHLRSLPGPHMGVSINVVHG